MAHEVGAKAIAFRAHVHPDQGCYGLCGGGIKKRVPEQFGGDLDRTRVAKERGIDQTVRCRVSQKIRQIRGINTTGEIIEPAQTLEDLRILRLK
jgi:hypothetical protein